MVFDDNSLKTLFEDKDCFMPHYIPDGVWERKVQVHKLKANCYEPLLRGQPANNGFIYGPNGSGKTLTHLFLQSHLNDFAEKKNIQGFKIFYLDCTDFSSEFEAAVRLSNLVSSKDLPKGLYLNDYYKAIGEEVKKNNWNVLVVLDEVDRIVLKEKSDKFLLSLLKINENILPKKTGEKSPGHLAILGITNNKVMYEYLSNNTKSRLGITKPILFPSYIQEELEIILNNRVAVGFKKNVVNKSAVVLAANLATRENGDARFALGMIKIAGELAEFEGLKRVTEAEVTKAKDEISKNELFEELSGIPLNSRLVYYAVYLLEKQAKEKPGSDDGNFFESRAVYQAYLQVCKRFDKDSIKERYFRENINRLDDLNLVETTIRSQRGKGKKKMIALNNELEAIDKAITELTAQGFLY